MPTVWQVDTSLANANRAAAVKVNPSESVPLAEVVPGLGSRSADRAECVPNAEGGGM